MSIFLKTSTVILLSSSRKSKKQRNPLKKTQTKKLHLMEKHPYFTLMSTLVLMNNAELLYMREIQQKFYPPSSARSMTWMKTPEKSLSNCSIHKLTLFCVRLLGMKKIAASKKMTYVFCFHFYIQYINYLGFWGFGEPPKPHGRV